jgi:hypothetical protein
MYLIYVISNSVAVLNCVLAWYRCDDQQSPPVHSDSPAKQRNEQCETHLRVLVDVRGGFCVTCVVSIHDCEY